MRIDVTGDLDAAAIARLRRAVHELAGSEVLIGVPAAKDGRTDNGGFGNAAIAYTQETGSPANNIPARPFLAPGVKDIVPAAVLKLEEAAKEALRGNRDKVRAILHGIGLDGVSAVRKRFDDNNWQALKKTTLDARLRRRLGKEGIRRLREKGEELPEPTQTKPLQDTMQLKKSIVHIVTLGKE